MTLPIYLDKLTLSTLGLCDNVIYQLNQICCDNFFVRKMYNPYRRLTLEFMSSMCYDPNRGFGFGRGLTTFRLFRIKHHFTHHDKGGLLGFPNGRDAYTIKPNDAFTQVGLDYFWGTIIRNYNPEPHTMFSENIHNPAIRYFHKILAHTQFGKEDNIRFISKDELFIMYSASQGGPVNLVVFMLANFDRIAREAHGTIPIGGLATMIVDAIGLRYRLYHKCNTVGELTCLFCVLS